MKGFGSGRSFSAFIVMIVVFLSLILFIMVDYVYYLDGLNDHCILITEFSLSEFY